MENSRIYVRGLPPKMTVEEFRHKFSNLAPITDAKFIPHRRIGYVGYKTSEDAARAIKYHNKTFVGLSRISVEFAKAFEGKPQGGKRGGEAGSIESRSREEQSYRKGQDPRGEKPQDEDVDGALPIKRGAPEKDALGDEDDQGAARKKQKLMSEDDHRQVPVPPRADHGPERFESTDENAPPSTHEDMTEPPKPSNDQEWLRSRTSRVLDLLDEDEDLAIWDSPPQDTDKFGENGADAKTGEQQTALSEEHPNQESSPLEASTEQDIPRSDTARLFLRNLSYTATEQDLRKYLEDHDLNGVSEVHLPRDSRTGSNKGFAHLEFEDTETASLALLKLDQKPFQGRILHILPSEPKRDSGLDEYAISKLPLKKQQAIKRKADAGKNTFNWNSMYMNSDAIMSSLSKRLGVAKSDLLDPSSSDAAVKQAHAETHVIQEAKAFFAANGIDTEAFQKAERGGTALLVKNFPYGTTSDDLKKLFEAYGTVRKLLMPDAGTIAIVDFTEESHATAAFRGLAYKRMNDSILFLEKAPKQLFNSSSSNSLPEVENSKSITKASTSDLLGPDQLSNAETSTLFIRNLNFATTDERLRQVFSPLGGYLSARVKTKADPKKPGQVLSMGFGFAEFRTKEQAQAALAAMNQYKLDGHELVIRPSQKTADVAEERRKADQAKKLAGRKTKIIIKNLPFEVTKKEVRSLFGAYGQLRSVRTPKKFDGSTRGFAFADFITAREAESAMDALKHTHFLGRRLVLEFAAEETVDPEAEIAAMQQKTSSQADKVALQELTGTGRKKFNVGGAADDGLES